MNPKNIRSTRDLRDLILVLEEAKIQQEYAISDYWETVKENYSPMNIFRKGVGTLIEGGKSNPRLIVSALGFGLGFLLKRLVIGKSPTVVRKIAGTALQVGLSSLLAKKSSANGAFNFLKRILTKKKKPGLLPD